MILMFACLFVLFGLLGLTSNNRIWRQTWGGLSTLSLGGFALSLVQDALRTGRLRFQFSILTRAHQPRLFWLAIALTTVAGMGTVIAGLWLLVLKS